MTQVIHGLPRKELLQEVFRNSSVSEAVKKIVTQAKAEHDSVPEKFTGEPSKLREREERRVSAGHQPVKRG